MRWLSSILRTVVVLLLAQIALWIDIVPAHAIERCNFGDNAPRTRPIPDAGPTEVHVAFFVFDLVDIITVKQEFILDFYLEAQWKDPRLGELLRKSGRQKCEVPMDDVWRPNTFLVNSRALQLGLPPVLHVYANGTVEAEQRALGTFGAHFDLSRFPLDTQTLQLTWLSTRYGPDELKIVLEGTDVEELVTETAWSIVGTRGYSGVFEKELIEGSTEETESFVRFDYELDVRRQAIYYLWKIFVPLSLIVFASWAGFWIDPTHLAVQTGIGTAMLLTAIAFLFSLQNIIPKITYLTRLDIFVYSSLVLIFLAFVESLGTCTIAAHGREVLARRIDLWSRVIFPLAFAAVLVWFWWL